MGLFLSEEGTDGLLKIDDIIRKENYVEILCISQDAEAWGQMSLQMDNDPKLNSKLVTKR